MRSAPQAWTPEDDAILRQEALKGRSALEIAGKSDGVFRSFAGLCSRDYIAAAKIRLTKGK
jgi:hypothetical protein